MNTNEQITSKINEWVRTAFKYHLALDGEVLISLNATETRIQKSAFDLFDLLYISSSRLQFDGGIRSSFKVINQLGKSIKDLLGYNTIIVDRFNLESTDGEFDLEKFTVLHFSDCDLLSAKIELQSQPTESINCLDSILNKYVSSTNFGKLRIFANLKSSSF